MSLEERFWRKVEKTDGCWLWTGQIERNGYGRIAAGGAGGRMLMVHRVAYELLVGAIPVGLEIDHVAARGCIHRNCVNPDHLEPVTHRENCRRAASRGGARGRRWRRSPADLPTTCKHGHEYTPENTRMRSRGEHEWRVCIACQANYNAARDRKVAV